MHKQKLETTIILLPTLLPNLSTYGLQMLIKLYRIPQETLVGVYNKSGKYEREGWGFEPLLKRLKSEEILGLFGHQISFTHAQPVINQQAILRWKSQKTLKIVVKRLVQNLQIYIKNLNVKYCRNKRFKGLESEFPAI